MEAEQRQLDAIRKAQQQIVTNLEEQISTLENRQKEIHELLQDSKTYQDSSIAADLNRELKENTIHLEQLHSNWEQASLRLEELAEQS